MSTGWPPPMTGVRLLVAGVSCCPPDRKTHDIHLYSVLNFVPDKAEALTFIIPPVVVRCQINFLRPLFLHLPDCAREQAEPGVGPAVLRRNVEPKELRRPSGGHGTNAVSHNFALMPGNQNNPPRIHVGFDELAQIVIANHPALDITREIIKVFTDRPLKQALQLMKLTQADRRDFERLWSRISVGHYQFSLA